MAKQKVVITVQAVDTRQEMVQYLDEIKKDIQTHYNKHTNRKGGVDAANTDYKWTWTISAHT